MCFLHDPLPKPSYHHPAPFTISDSGLCEVGSIGRDKGWHLELHNMPAFSRHPSNKLLHFIASEPTINATSLSPAILLTQSTEESHIGVEKSTADDSFEEEIATFTPQPASLSLLSAFRYDARIFHRSLSS